VPERSIGAVSKTVVLLAGDRGFESLPLRHSPASGRLSLSRSRTEDRRFTCSAHRRQRHEGIDPLDAKQPSGAQRVSVAKGRTFRECAVEFIEKNRAGWRNAKHAAQWTATLATYFYPTLGELPVAAIDAGLIVQVLDPIWAEKPETASRVRGRIEAVLDAATGAASGRGRTQRNGKATSPISCRRAYRLSARSRRNGIGARDRKQGRGGLPARRSFRETAECRRFGAGHLPPLDQVSSQRSVPRDRP
jgi:hypothetical protein